MAVSPSRSRSVSQPRSSATPSASLFSNIYIELAFLRAIAAYRPLGQHKHFNLVPILRDLDRAIQAEQARRKRQNLPPLQDTLEGADEKAANAQISAKGKAKADGQGQDGLAISAQEVWERLEELYDLEALDELDVAQDSGNGSASPDAGPSRARSSSLRGPHPSGLTLPPSFPHPRPTEFTLEPWDEYDEIMAPRRVADEASLKSESEDEEMGVSSDLESAEDVEKDEGEEEEEHEEQEDEEGEEAPTSGRTRAGAKAKSKPRPRTRTRTSTLSRRSRKDEEVEDEKTSSELSEEEETVVKDEDVVDDEVDQENEEQEEEDETEPEQDARRNRPRNVRTPTSTRSATAGGARATRTPTPSGVAGSPPQVSPGSPTASASASGSKRGRRGSTSSNADVPREEGALTRKGPGKGWRKGLSLSKNSETPAAAPSPRSSRGRATPRRTRK